MPRAEFSKLAGILNTALSQHLLEFEIAQFELPHDPDMNRDSGGDGIPAELFQILKDDAVKVLHSICQQIWKTQQWP